MYLPSAAFFGLVWHGLVTVLAVKEYWLIEIAFHSLALL
jgi:hypothetical protein